MKKLFYIDMLNNADQERMAASIIESHFQLGYDVISNIDPGCFRGYSKLDVVRSCYENHYKYDKNMNNLKKVFGKRKLSEDIVFVISACNFNSYDVYNDDFEFEFDKFIKKFDYVCNVSFVPNNGRYEELFTYYNVDGTECEPEPYLIRFGYVNYLEGCYSRNNFEVGRFENLLSYFINRVNFIHALEGSKFPEWRDYRDRDYFECRNALSDKNYYEQMRIL